MFEQPVVEVLSRSKSVLLAGCGGGYDVLGAVPIALELFRAGKNVSLASLSFTRLDSVPGHEAAAVPFLYRTLKSAATREAYCPEAWLSSWLTESFGQDVPVWCFDNVGPKALRRAYEHLVHEREIDTVVLIDGGVDSLLRGDETSLGTPVEDLASIAAVDSLDVDAKLLMCIGFGAEMRDGICHAQVLSRIAELTRDGGFLGAWPLLANSEQGRMYEAAAAYVSANQKSQRGSHIHSVVRASMRSEFGSHGDHVWISPLASFYWCFSLAQVASQNLLLPHISDAETLWEIAAIVEAVRKTLAIQTKSSIPL
jgi:hypothetical protein